jgi:hypothetical protein
MLVNDRISKDILAAGEVWADGREWYCARGARNSG